MSLLLAAVGVLTFASCQHEYADWTPGEKETNMGVYFANTEGFEVSAEDSSVDIEIKRLNTEAAATVTLRSVDESGLFTIPQSVSFNAGAESAMLNIQFDGAALEIGTLYPIAIKLDEAEATKYAVSEATFTIGIPEPWVSMGEGIYFDDFLAGVFAEADSFRGLGTYVAFEKHELEPNRIRAVNVFSPETLGSMWGGVPSWLIFTTSEPTYIEFDITDPTNVALAGARLEGDGTSAVAAPTYIQMESGGTTYDLYMLIWEGNPIVLEEGIIKFPTSGMEVAAFAGGSYAGYFAKANPSGYMQFYLPGTEFVNYDIAATYDGMFVGPDSATAEAIFTFMLGADVASYKFAFVADDVTADPSAAVAAIVEGSEDLTIFESDADTRQWQVELTRGLYTLVAVPYTAEGEARVDDAYAYSFWFNGTGEAPEVTVDVEIGAPSSLVAPEKAEEVEASRPACFNVGAKITANGADIKAIKYWLGDMAAVEEAGLTVDDVLTNLAGDASAWIPSLVESGAVVGTFNVNANSTVTVLMRFETVYGTKIDFQSEPYALPAYDGDFQIGDYLFADGEGEQANEMVFSIIPGKSYESFYFVHSQVEGSAWYATLDAEAGTMSVAGIELGYEDYGNQYGQYYAYFNQERTQLYAYLSLTSMESKDPSAPMVLTVADNQLAGLQTYFLMNIYGAAEGELIGTYFYFTPTTVITPYEAPAEPTAKALSVSPMSGKEASFSAVEANFVAAVEPSIVIKATPIEGFDFTPATLKF